MRKTLSYSGIRKKKEKVYEEEKKKTKKRMKEGQKELAGF
jgi:hypothetical protein